MIWLTKLLKNVDGFYTKATGDVNPAETPEEARARRRAKILEEKTKAEEAAQQHEIDKEKQAIAGSAGRKALAQLNEWEIPDPLYNDYRAFMEVYTEIFTLIDQINPNIVSEKLQAAYNELEGMAKIDSDKAVESFEDEIRSSEERFQRLAQVTGHKLRWALQTLLNNPYLSKMKSIKDAKKELNERGDKKSPMWEDWGFSSLDFVKAIKALAEDANESALYTLGGIESAAKVMEAKNKPDEERRTFQEGEGIGRAIEEGLTPNQNRQEAVNRAVRKYRANVREAVRFAKNKNFHSHIESAIRVAEQRERYEKALKADPERYKKLQAQGALRTKRFREKFDKLEDIVKLWAVATTPEQKALLKERNKKIYLKTINSRGLSDENQKEAEAMLDADKALEQTFETVKNNTVKKTISNEKINEENRAAKINRGILDLVKVEFKQKINSRPNDFKRSASIKTQLSIKLKEYETTKFAQYKLAVSKAHEKWENAISPMAKLEADMEVTRARAALAKAENDFKETLDPVQKVKNHVDKLRTIRKMVLDLAKMGIIDNSSLLKPEQAPVVQMVIEQSYELLNDYPFQNMVEATVARELLEKLSALLADNTENQYETPEVGPEEMPPEEIDLTEKLSSLNTGILMNKKSRKKMLKRIEKQALQRTNLQTILDRAVPVDMNLPSKEYADQVYKSISDAVVSTIDDDLDRLIQEIEAED